MRKPLLAAVVVAATLVAVAPASAAKSHTLRFQVTLPNSATITNPPGLFESPTEPPPGAYTIAGSGTANGPGSTDGTTVFSGIIVSADTTLINAIIALPKGQIMIMGPSTQKPGATDRFAIVGGTGKYRGIRGEAVQTNDKTTDGPTGAETFTLTLHY